VIVTYSAMVMPGPGAALERVERPVPEPAAGEAVVRIRATSLNFHDWVNLAGLIPGPWPRVPLTDGCGEVVAVGEGVRKLSVGDRVIQAFYPRWLSGPPTSAAKREAPGDTGDGMLQQYALVPANALVHVPAHLSDVEAATIPCAGVTAWSSLRRAGTKPGDVVVVEGTGGVSLFTVQLAKAAGATVVLTSSSDEKLAVGRSLGADHLINYRSTPEWHREVLAVTDGAGADVVVDVGGPDTLGAAVKAVRNGGFVAIVGVLTGAGTAEIPVATAMSRNVRLEGITVGSVADHVDLCRAMAVGQIHPHVSHTFGWDEVPEALRVLEAHEHIGKVAVEVS
jgi:NADPH:quinone reductase-like Zn-dependent oxidoreductase